MASHRRFGPLTGWVASQAHRASRGQGDRNYEPKQCRTSGCTLPYRHEGRCEGRNRQALHVKLPPKDSNSAPRHQLRRRARGIGLQDGGRLVRTSPRGGGAKPGAIAHMAEIRAHRNPPTGRSGRQVRQDRALAKASRGLGA